jgi:hypothetical protein
MHVGFDPSGSPMCFIMALTASVPNPPPPDPPPPPLAPAPGMIAYAYEWNYKAERRKRKETEKYLIEEDNTVLIFFSELIYYLGSLSYVSCN